MQNLPLFPEREWPSGGLRAKTELSVQRVPDRKYSGTDLWFFQAHDFNETICLLSRAIKVFAVLSP
jgi:hypothetical protein